MSFVQIPGELETLEVHGPTSRKKAVLSFSMWEGQVSDVHAYASTEVEGEGGGGSISTTWGNVQGRVEPITVRSTTTHHQKVFITSPEGERVVELQNSALSFRAGNRAAAHFVGLAGDASQPFFAVVNQDQDLMQSFEDNLDPVVRKAFGFKADHYRSYVSLFFSYDPRAPDRRRASLSALCPRL